MVSGIAEGGAGEEQGSSLSKTFFSSLGVHPRSSWLLGIPEEK